VGVAATGIPSRPAINAMPARPWRRCCWKVMGRVLDGLEGASVPWLTHQG
jgi:hypothetical protein